MAEVSSSNERTKNDGGDEKNSLAEMPSYTEHLAVGERESSLRAEIMNAINALKDGSNDEDIDNNLRMYYEANRGKRTSIFHENIVESNRLMMMSPFVFDKMNALAKETDRTKKEHAFLVLGFVTEDTPQKYYLDRIAVDDDLSDEQREQFYLSYPDLETGDSVADLNIILHFYGRAIREYVNKEQTNGRVPLVVLGHTHPNASESYGNYSLPDLVYIPGQERAISDKVGGAEFEYCHIVLPVNGDVDAVFLDKADGRFKKISGVYCIDDQNYSEVPAFTFESPKELSDSHVSYVKERGEQGGDDDLYMSVFREVLGES